MNFLLPTFLNLPHRFLACFIKQSRLEASPQPNIAKLITEAKLPTRPPIIHFFRLSCNDFFIETFAIAKFIIWSEFCLMLQ